MGNKNVFDITVVCVSLIALWRLTKSYVSARVDRAVKGFTQEGGEWQSIALMVFTFLCGSSVYSLLPGSRSFKGLSDAWNCNSCWSVLRPRRGSGRQLLRTLASVNPTTKKTNPKLKETMPKQVPKQRQ